ncbi:MAG: ATP-binding protein [Acetobacteraceae bacterium]|nr:ATP-binding protein [Acetobacteraceae bacterium]
MTMDACASPERLAALRRYGVLDTPRERDFDRIVTLLARICDAPIAVINLIEDHRQWFKAEVGLGIDGTPLDVSICRHFLLQPGITVIADMTRDARLAANPLIAGEPALRFYAGCLLTSRDDAQPLGTLCVLDHRARPEGLDETQRLALETLAGEVMAQLELRLALRERQAALEAQALLLKEIHHRVRNSLQLVGSVVNLQLRSVDDAAARAALEDTSRRIRSIAALHGRLHQSDRLDAVELDRFLEELVDELRAGAPPGAALTLTTAARPLVPVGAAVTVALLLNELVANALKHAYPNGAGGPVEVTLMPAADGRLTLAVRDHGRGLPPGMAEPARPGSLGARLIAALAAQLRGTLRFEAAHPGTRACLEFEAGLEAALPGN